MVMPFTQWLVCDAMAALMPRAHGLPGVLDTDVDAFLARFAEEAEPLLWLGVVSGACLFQVSPPVTLGRLAPAARLTAAERDAHARALAQHPLYLVRQAMMLVRIAAGLCWGAHPVTRAAMMLAPYPGEPLRAPARGSRAA